MPWYILVCIGFLIGLAITNGWLRHHTLTIIIWLCKGTVWCCEWVQDRFDNVAYVPQVKKVAHQKIKEELIEKTLKPEPVMFDFETATNEEILKHVSQTFKENPKQIAVQRKAVD